MVMVLFEYQYTVSCIKMRVICGIFWFCGENLNLMRECCFIKEIQLNLIMRGNEKTVRCDSCKKNISWIRWRRLFRRKFEKTVRWDSCKKYFMKQQERIFALKNLRELLDEKEKGKKINFKKEIIIIAV